MQNLLWIKFLSILVDFFFVSFHELYNIWPQYFITIISESAETWQSYFSCLFFWAAACSLSSLGNSFTMFLRNSRKGLKSCSVHIAGTSERVPGVQMKLWHALATEPFLPVFGPRKIVVVSTIVCYTTSNFVL